MQVVEQGCFIIIGRTKSGKEFRPSDWDQRLCGTLSEFNSGKLQYASTVAPIRHDRDKAVWVDGRLQKENYAAWKFMLNFAHDNDLQIEWPDICILPEKV